MDLPNLTYLNPEQFGKFSRLIFDYLNQSNLAAAFYGEFPSDASFKIQAEKKLNEYQHREVVARVLETQMNRLDLSPKQIENLSKFKSNETVTVTTGHQLNLLTGPLYFFYKILQTLKCCEQMNRIHPEYNFVPIFWMATEDHDFEEINHFFHKSQKFAWERTVSCAVGNLNLDGIEELFKTFRSQLPETYNAKNLEELIKESYLSSENLIEATQKLVQALFSDFGLLMIDGNDKELKGLMIPAFQEELLKQTAFEKVSKTNEQLIEKGYSVQVNPREINLFYLGEGEIRERIIYENDTFSVLNSSYHFTQNQIIEELNEHPEKFSPNVLVRPLYQETILPNIAYIGGSGEIAYWLQLKAYFESQKVLFPLLIVRNSGLILNSKEKSKIEKLGIDFTDLFKPKHQLISENVMQNCHLEIDFDAYEKQIEKIFSELTDKSTETDVTFGKMVTAQKVKQLKGLQKMRQRFIKAEKKKQSERVERIEKIYAEIFPQGNLQERVMNFSDLWLQYDKAFIKEVYDEIHPYEFRFIIKTLP